MSPDKTIKTLTSSICFRLNQSFPIFQNYILYLYSEHVVFFIVSQIHPGDQFVHWSDNSGDPSCSPRGGCVVETEQDEGGRGGFGNEP